jgi:DNA-binding transcriptional ArsR family regulator
MLKGDIVGLQQTLKALSDPIRREILNLLKEGPRSAGDITEQFPVTGASISRHLSVLKEADLVRDSREGQFIFYQLNASVLEEILLWISHLQGTNSQEETVSGDTNETH